MQTVYENTLMQHHVALPPDAMGKVTYIAPPGQYSLKVRLFPLHENDNCTRMHLLSLFFLFDTYHTAQFLLVAYNIGTDINEFFCMLNLGRTSNNLNLD